MIKGIQKVHKPWVKPVAGLLAAGIVVYEAMLGQYIYIPIGQGGRGHQVVPLPHPLPQRVDLG